MIPYRLQNKPKIGDLINFKEAWEEYEIEKHYGIVLKEKSREDIFGVIPKDTNRFAGVDVMSKEDFREGIMTKGKRIFYEMAVFNFKENTQEIKECFCDEAEDCIE